MVNEEEVMKILLNGKEKEFAQLKDLKDLISQFCRDHNHVIAEVNGEIIKCHRWDATTIKDGDTVELVNFVGGG